MKFFIPRELTDPMVRNSVRIPHGKNKTIDLLVAEVDRFRDDWLMSHPGWAFTGTNLEKCTDGTVPPAYDVCLGFQRPRTLEEQETQDQDRTAYMAQKESDYTRRADEQRALLEQVLGSLKS